MHENELPPDVLKQVIDLNNYDEVYMDVTRYLYDTYVQLRGTPLKNLWRGEKALRFWS